MWLWRTSRGLFQACRHQPFPADRELLLCQDLRSGRSVLAGSTLSAFPRILQVSVWKSPPQQGLPNPVCTSSSPIPCPLSALTWICLSHFNYWNHLLAAWLTLTSKIRGKRCPGISEPRFCSFVDLWQALWLPFSRSGNPEIAGGEGSTLADLLEDKGPQGERHWAVPSRPSSKFGRKTAQPSHKIARNKSCCF